jgi:hypothetical protein
MTKQVTSPRLCLAAALAAVLCAAAAPAHAAPAGIAHLLGGNDDKEQAKDDKQAADDESKAAGGDASGKPAKGDKPAKDDESGASDDAPATPDAGAGEPPALAPVAPPVAGRSVAATVTAGSVRVRLPGSDGYLPLTGAASMPVGSVVDTRTGAVAMQVALPGRPAETATFSGAMFEVSQGDGVTELRLRGGDFGKCAPAAGRALASIARHKKKKSPVVRRLWASDDGGHFRTHGHNSVATVRGTSWLTEDRCDGTLVRVKRGKVAVRDFGRRKTVLVKKGHAYLARA